MGGWGVERDHWSAGLWRHGPAGAAQYGLHRNLERGECRVQPVSFADAWRDRGDAIACNRSIKKDLSRKTCLRRMDRHHELDRAAGRLGSWRPQDAGRTAAGWKLQTLRVQNFHYLW